MTNPLPDVLYDPSTGFSFQLASDAFTDPEGSTLTYTAKKSDGSNLPSWLTFNASTRTFSGTTPMLTDASWSIRVTTTDPSGASVYDDFVFTTTSGGGSQAMVYEMGLSQETLTQSYTQTSGPASVQVQDRWFTYDALNRIKISGGTLVAGAPGQNATIQLQPSTPSNEAFEVGYDAAGRQTVIYRQMTVGNQGVKTFATQTIYDARGNRIYLYNLQELGGANTGVQTAYTYDAANQVTESRSYFSVGAESWKAGPLDGEGYPLYMVNIGGMLSGRETFQYDADGRMVRQDTQGRPTGDTWWQNPSWSQGAPSAQYGDASVLQLQARVDYTQGDGTSAWQDTDLSNNASKYDAAGRLTGYRYSAKQDGNWFTHTFASSFEGWEGWSEKQVSGTSSNSNYKPTTNTLSYDRYGRLAKQQEHTEYQSGAIDDRVRVYASTGEGQVLNRREGTWKDGQFAEGDADGYGSKPLYRYVYANGQSMAELKDGGQVRAGMTLGIQSVAGMEAYEVGGGMVVPLAGETLRTLAQRVYGTSSQWYVLADANGLSDPEATLTAGVQLKAPSTTVGKNDAGTFKPYNPNEAIGSTSPSLPYIQPPDQSNCLRVTAILIRVVAAVVTVFAPNPYTAMVVAGGGEFAAQTAEIAGNWREGYNYADIARAVVMAGATGGNTGASLTQRLGNAAIQAGMRYAGDYVYQRLTGNDPTFSWKNVAVEVGTSLVTEGLFGENAVRGNGVESGIRVAKTAQEAYNWSKIAVEALKSAGRAVVTAGVHYGMEKAILHEASWDPESVGLSALQSGLTTAGVLGWKKLEENIKTDENRKDKN
ncbi:MAG: putative Ig domain-containing protein, partial [Lysobacteraceae bacterium]